MKQFFHHFQKQSSGLLLLSTSLVMAGTCGAFGVTTTTTTTTACSSSEANGQRDSAARRERDRIIFLGTGSSTGCPKPLCTMLFNPKYNKKSFAESDKSFEEMRERFRGKCDVSNKAIVGNPLYNKNYRNNPSLLICHYDENEGRTKHIIIDVGKTFRETSLRWFPEHGINSLDAIILTHEHADAAMGMDDVRGYQRVLPSDVHKKPTTVPMNVYLSQPCLDKLRQVLPWVFPPPKPVVQDPTKPVVERFVSTVKVNVFESFETLNVEGLKVITLPVMHGEDLVSYGFAFTVGKTNIVYLSDISRMLPETLDYIQSKLPPTDILVVDSLHATGKHPVHFSLEQAVDCVQQIKPKRTYIVGISCDSFPPHDEMNQHLQTQYGKNVIQFAHDGLSIDC